MRPPAAVMRGSREVGKRAGTPRRRRMFMRVTGRTLPDRVAQQVKAKATVMMAASTATAMAAVTATPMATVTITEKTAKKNLKWASP
jgi:hypothetical protein